MTLKNLPRKSSVNAARRALLRAVPALGVFALGGRLSRTAWAAPQKSGAVRLVSIGPSITEIIYALGAGSLLVGVDSSSSYPEATKSLANVGYARTLSAEGILALAPTKLIVTEDAGPPLALRQISDAGIPVQVLSANHRFEGVIERVTEIGRSLGRESEAAQLKQSLNKEWAQAQAEIRKAKGRPIKVLYIHSMNPGQVMVSGTDTNANAMLNYAGLQNTVNSFTGYKPLTAEALVMADPDVVLVTDQGLKTLGGIDAVLKLPGLESTQAGKNRRVISMDAIYLLGFGPRMPSAVLALNRKARQAMA